MTVKTLDVLISGVHAGVLMQDASGALSFECFEAIAERRFPAPCRYRLEPIAIKRCCPISGVSCLRTLRREGAWL